MTPIEVFLDAILEMRNYFMTEFYQDVVKIEIDPLLNMELMQSMAEHEPAMFDEFKQVSTIFGFPVEVNNDQFRRDGLWIAFSTKKVS